ncbi:hypothetical protein FNV43_RR10936 [Rhamnella rubrinervis]|uniref:FAF domain-containing protein n=1 Tax=Rhamnella rubrinervis TaxID=2594499 RepID=A0A8K0MGT0_9ROSA|nr:hypothetical protein FNV43_RR10936 [Rhamnella rubrinervis]
MNSHLLSTASFSGDHIGVESCVDVFNADEDHSTDDDQGHPDRSIRRRCRRDQWWPPTRKKEFPPPIPSLARTENLPSHMPWVLKRHYTSDGRLILTEEKVKHHEYFRAHRSNGRLTLQLVPLDGDVLEPATVEEVDKIVENIDQSSEWTGVHPDVDMTINSSDDEKGYDLMDGHGVDVDVGDDDRVEHSSKKEGNTGIAVSGNGGGNWIKYSTSVRSGAPCMFGSVTVQAIRPVHT